MTPAMHSPWSCHGAAISRCSHIDVSELMGDGLGFGVPIYTYRNFRREQGVTAEEALGELRSDGLAELGVQIPNALVTDCVRLCCSLCLLESDPTVISPDVLSKDHW